jgi:hypothetical protein
LAASLFVGCAFVKTQDMTVVIIGQATVKHCIEAGPEAPTTCDEVEGGGISDVAGGIAEKGLALWLLLSRMGSALL